MIKDQIDKDLKQAMLSGDKQLVTVIRTIKSAILNAEISAGARDTGLDEQTVISLLQKESKKRVEAADLYAKAGSQDKADQELYEREIINKYLPEMMSEEELSALVDEIISSMEGPLTKQHMGQIIGAVKQKANGSADGAMIARVVSQRLS